MLFLGGRKMLQFHLCSHTHGISIHISVCCLAVTQFHGHGESQPESCQTAVLGWQLLLNEQSPQRSCQLSVEWRQINSWKHYIAKTSAQYWSVECYVSTYRVCLFLRQKVWVVLANTKYGLQVHVNVGGRDGVPGSHVNLEQPFFTSD